MVSNEWIPVNIVNMEKHIIKNTEDILKKEIFNIEKRINENDIINNIIEKMKQKMNNDYFWYLIMDNNFCVYKNRKTDKFCYTRIINKNNKYLCSKHDPNYIKKCRPKKEKKKEINMNIKLNYDIDKITSNFNLQIDNK